MINDEKIIKLKPGTNRSLEQIKKEYMEACGGLGELTQLIKEHETRKEMSHQRIFELKQEYAKVEAALKSESTMPIDESHPFTKEPVP